MAPFVFKLVNNLSHTEFWRLYGNRHFEANPSDRRIFSDLHRLTMAPIYDQFGCKRYQKKRYQVGFKFSYFFQIVLFYVNARPSKIRSLHFLSSNLDGFFWLDLYSVARNNETIKVTVLPEVNNDWRASCLKRLQPQQKCFRRGKCNFSFCRRNPPPSLTLKPNYCVIFVRDQIKCDWGIFERFLALPTFGWFVLVTPETPLL